MRPHRLQPTRLRHPWDSPGKNTGVGCHFLLQCMKVKNESDVAQSCLTPSDPVDCSLPGSSVHGIFQATVLEWGAIAFSHSLNSGQILHLRSLLSKLMRCNENFNAYSWHWSVERAHFFTHLGNFWQGKCSHHQQEAKNAFQEFMESQSMDFYATGINNRISCWQKYVDCNGSYFD